MTKTELDEIYSRPEAHPFERIHALMEFYVDELSSYRNTVRRYPNDDCPANCLGNNFPMPDDYEKEIPEIKPGKDLHM
jgi:hypothetical protein